MQGGWEANRGVMVRVDGDLNGGGGEEEAQEVFHK